MNIHFPLSPVPQTLLQGRNEQTDYYYYFNNNNTYYYLDTTHAVLSFF